MDKNGKIGGKVSIIDILVVVLVVAVIVGIVARYGSSVTGAVKSNKQFEYVLKVERVRQYTVDALRKKARLQIKNLKKTWAKLLMYRLKMQHCSQQQHRVNLKILNCQEDILAM